MSSLIIPDKTVQLVKDLGSDAPSLPEAWQNWSYVESSEPDHFGPHYESYRNSFRTNSVNFMDGAGKSPPYNENSFRATIIIGAEADLLFGHDNRGSSSDFTTSYSATIGTEQSYSFEWGMQFSMGVEFGSEATGKVNAQLGFDLRETTTETFRQEKTQTYTVTVPAKKEVYVYQLAFKCAVINGYSTGGGYKWRIETVGIFQDHSSITASLDRLL